MCSTKAIKWWHYVADMLISIIIIIIMCCWCAHKWTTLWCIMNISLDPDTTSVAVAAAALQLPQALENFTLGMLLGDVNFTQFINLSMDNLTEHIHEQLQRAEENGTLDNGGAGAAGGGGGHTGPRRDPLTVVVPVTVCYAIIFIAGVLGNVITCTVISRNKSMHTATNYYLFNLAISDLMLLLSGELILYCVGFDLFYRIVYNWFSLHNCVYMNKLNIPINKSRVYVKLIGN